MHCRSWVACCLLRYRSTLKITRNPLVVKSEVKNFMQYFTDFTQNDKNEENCWYLGKSLLTWAFSDAYQLYTVHRPLRSCQTFMKWSKPPIWVLWIFSNLMRFFGDHPKFEWFWIGFLNMDKQLTMAQKIILKYLNQK